MNPGRLTIAWTLLTTTACFPPAIDSDDTETDSEGETGSGSGTTAVVTTVGAGDSDGGDTSTGGVAPSPACADYLACLTDTQSRELMAAQEQFGPGGPCWTDQASADACAEQCDAGLETCALAEGDGTGDAPLLCSIDAVAPGVRSPVVMGDRAGMLPTEIGQIVEDFCGCHLVENNDQLVELTPEYNGPIRLTTLEEFHAPFQGQPTYRVVELRSITQLNMPPVYHCDTLDFGSLPTDAYEAMADWVDAGAPDGASWPRR